MSSGYQDIFMNQGDTFTLQTTLTDDNGLPYNLSGFSVASKAKKSYYAANSVITFEASVYDANNGIIQLSANASTTSNVTSGKLVYDVVITDENGTVTRVLEGQVIVSPGVTL